MLESRIVLIFDDSGYGTLDLAFAVEERQGLVAGPVATVAEAMAIIETTDVGGAVIDCDVGDCAASPLILHLTERRIPVVIQTSSNLPDALHWVRDRMAVMLKPVDARLVIDSLIVEIGRRLQPINPLALGKNPKQV